MKLEVIYKRVLDIPKESKELEQWTKNSFNKVRLREYLIMLDNCIDDFKEVPLNSILEVSLDGHTIRLKGGRL